MPHPASAADQTCAGETATIVADSYGDTIQGTAGNDVIVGGEGPDEIHGGGGNDKICGGAGGDELYGEDGDDVLYGESGDDLLDDGAGNDQAFGGTGDDAFTAGAGDDVMIGGPDSEPSTTQNSVDYSNSTAPVVIDLREDSATGYGDDLVKHIWAATGSNYDDAIIGTPVTDSLYGGCGNDQLYGKGGKDWLFGSFDDGPACNGLTSTDDDGIYGGAGDDIFRGENSGNIGTDTLLGGSGDDLLSSNGGRERFYGGDGHDTFSALLLSGSSLHLDLAAGTYTIGDNTGEVGDVEEVVGTQDNDILRGDGEANVFIGGDGADRVYGLGGNDTLRGDRVRGQSAQWSDVAFGGSGTDSCRAEVKKSCER
jgi:Ca2+-binding RTX toxin-like protein